MVGGCAALIRSLHSNRRSTQDVERDLRSRWAVDRIKSLELDARASSRYRHDWTCVRVAERRDLARPLISAHEHSSL